MCGCEIGRNRASQSHSLSQRQLCSIQPVEGATKLVLAPNMRCVWCISHESQRRHVCYCLSGCHPDPRLGPSLGPSRFHSGSEGFPPRFAMCFVKVCFTAFRTHPGPESGGHPGPSWSHLGPERSFQDRAPRGPCETD